MFEGKTLLITGGTGSFGSTVLKRFIKSDLNHKILYEIPLKFENPPTIYSVAYDKNFLNSG